MAEIRLEKRAVIRTDPAAVYAELAEPRNQLGLQPFLVEVREVESGDGSATRAFDAVEQVPVFGPVRLRNRIRVRIALVHRDEAIDFEARSFPGIVVRSRFELAAHPDGTHVVERVCAVVPALVRGFVAPRLDRAQTALLANLKIRLEERRPTG